VAGFFKLENALTTETQRYRENQIQLKNNIRQKCELQLRQGWGVPDISAHSTRQENGQVPSQQARMSIS
jgi:hypothetical protein